MHYQLILTGKLYSHPEIGQTKKGRLWVKLLLETEFVREIRPGELQSETTTVPISFFAGPAEQVRQLKTGETLTIGCYHFNRELRCTLTVKDQPVEPGTICVVRSEWTGRPKKKHIAEYRQWTLTTHQFLTDRWGKRMIYALGIAPNLTEFWAFEPGRAPKLIQKVAAGIP